VAIVATQSTPENNMNTNTTAEVSTKPNAESEAVITNLTLNWDGMTAEDIQALAQQALIVKLQGGWRKNGIPQGDFTVNVVDHKVGARAPRGPVNVAALIDKMSPEEKAALLAKLQA
jgi:hypothetical protein